MSFFFIDYDSEDNESRWAERGCTVELTNISSASADNLESITTCSQSGCNNGNIMYSHCVLCESDVKGKCATLSDASVFIGQCEGIYSHDRRGCYTLNKGK